MEIGVIGINEYAKQFCKHWIKRGHKILFADLDRCAPSYSSASSLGPEVTLTWPETVARNAEIIVLAVHPHWVYAAIRGLGEIRHKVILDIILDEGEGRNSDPPFSSTFKEIQKLLPEAKVVKITPDFPQNLFQPEYPSTDNLYSYSNYHLAQRMVRWFMDGSGYQIIELESLKVLRKN